MTAAQKTQALNNLGIADWAKASTKPSYTWTEITGKPNIIAIKQDGVAEAGQYFDFHVTSDTTSDYNVRLACPNVTLQWVTLPSESGTLALTKDFLPLSGGTVTGTVTIKQSNWTNGIILQRTAANAGTGIKCLYSTGAEIGNFGINGNKEFEVNFAGANGTFKVNSSIEVSANAFFEYSDERLKNVKDNITVNFDDIEKLPKIYYTLKNGSVDDVKIGTIAQEVQKIYPELVKEDADGYLSVQYDKLSIIALAAIDKLYRENNEMKKDIKQIKEKLGL